MSTNGTRFYGKFRGVVTDNRDPLMMGRVRARVTDVMGEDESGWAMPAAPFTSRLGNLEGRRSGSWVLLS